MTDNSLFMCECKPNERIVQIDDKVEQYLRYIEKCSTRQAIMSRKELTNWCRHGGYTRDELRQSKQRVINRMGGSL